MINILVDNIFVKFGGCLLRQVTAVPKGTNCAPLLPDLFLHSRGSEFLDSDYRRLARSFNLCYRYTDDLIVLNNKRLIDYVKDIYPSELNVEKANRLNDQANYLDLTIHHRQQQQTLRKAV